MYGCSVNKLKKYMENTVIVKIRKNLNNSFFTLKLRKTLMEVTKNKYRFQIIFNFPNTTILFENL